jgi:type I restriction enzyme M protein
VRHLVHRELARRRLRECGRRRQDQPLVLYQGSSAERTWYYDLSGIKVGKKSPLTLAHFEECSRLLPERGDSDHSWSVSRAGIEAKSFDLKAVNPHAKNNVDTRTPEQPLDPIEEKGKEVAAALAALRSTLPKG